MNKLFASEINDISIDFNQYLLNMWHGVKSLKFMTGSIHSILHYYDNNIIGIVFIRKVTDSLTNVDFDNVITDTHNNSFEILYISVGNTIAYDDEEYLPFLFKYNDYKSLLEDVISDISAHYDKLNASRFSCLYVCGDNSDGNGSDNRGNGDDTGGSDNRGNGDDTGGSDNRGNGDGIIDNKQVARGMEIYCIYQLMAFNKIYVSTYSAIVKPLRCGELIRVNDISYATWRSIIVNMFLTTILKYNVFIAARPMSSLCYLDCGDNASLLYSGTEMINNWIENMSYKNIVDKFNKISKFIKGGGLREMYNGYESISDDDSESDSETGSENGSEVNGGTADSHNNVVGKEDSRSNVVGKEKRGNTPTISDGRKHKQGKRLANDIDESADRIYSHHVLSPVAMLLTTVKYNGVENIKDMITDPQMMFIVIFTLRQLHKIGIVHTQLTIDDIVFFEVDTEHINTKVLFIANDEHEYYVVPIGKYIPLICNFDYSVFRSDITYALNNNSITCYPDDDKEYLSKRIKESEYCKFIGNDNILSILDSDSGSGGNGGSGGNSGSGGNGGSGIDSIIREIEMFDTYTLYLSCDKQSIIQGITSLEECMKTLFKDYYMKDIDKSEITGVYRLQT